jgi:hypothetical protein
VSGEGELTESQKRQPQVVFSAVSVVLGEVPILGSVFNELRSYDAQRRIERRLHTLAEELTEQMKGVRRESVNWGFLNTEAFQDLIRKAVETAIRTRDRQKITLVAQILKGAAVSFRQENRAAAEEYLYLISDLTPQELIVALSAYNQRLAFRGERASSSEAWDTWAENVSSETGVDIVDLRFALGRIVSSGLLDRVSTGRDETGSFFSEPEEDEVGLYRVTPAFEKLMKFLGQDAEGST